MNISESKNELESNNKREREREEGDDTVVALRKAYLVKRRNQISDDLYEDVRYIFHTSIIETLNGRMRSYISTMPPILGLLEPDEFEQKLELPRIMPPIRDFSDKFVLVCESCVATYGTTVMVFLIDWCKETRKVSMFHVLTFMFKHITKGSSGYAAIGERLYFVGGFFIDENGTTPEVKASKKFRRLLRRKSNGSDPPLYSDVLDKVQRKWPQLLGTSSYNLRTAKWERDTPCLNGAKPEPVVFVYDGKIFAIGGYHPYARENAPQFEFVDLKCQILGTPRFWSELPAPPCDMKYYWYHILDETNGILFLFFQKDVDKYSKDSYSEDNYPCCQLNLKETPYRWNQEACVSKFCNIPDQIPNNSVLLTHTEFPINQSRGCIVDNIIFFYENDPESGKPVIRAQYMDWDKSSWEPWVIDGLDEVLKGKVETTMSVGYLNHIGNYRFCLNIQYAVGPGGTTSALYSLIFELVKRELRNEYRRATPCDASEAQKASKFEFVFKHICDGAFQVPQYFKLRCCKKL